MTDLLVKKQNSLIGTATLWFAGMETAALVMIGFVCRLWFSVLLFALVETIILLIFRRVLRNFFDREIIGSRELKGKTLSGTKNVITNISHELRTPLNGIIGFAEELYEKESDETKREALRAVRINGEKLHAVTEKLIDFASIDSGLYKTDIRLQNVYSLLMTLRSKFEQGAREKGLTLRFENSVDREILLYFDFHAMFKVLAMLLENAVKFTPQGEILISTEYKEPLLSFRVCDTGEGIEESRKDQIFNFYEQGSTELDRPYEGVGLGLAIARKLMEIQGGEISLEANNPRGTCFAVSLKTSAMEIGPSVQTSEGKGGNPRKWDDRQKKIIGSAAESIQSSLKVFNDSRIKEIARELAAEDPLFTGLADRLETAAARFDESAVAAMVKEMLEEAEE